MKYLWITALALTLIITLLWVGTAFADGGPHGGYTATTDACAGCHRAHTAIGEDLLKSASSYELCISCHNGTSANTKVTDGLWVGTGGGSLKGGGFTNATMNVALGAGPATAATTSKHAVFGMSGYSSDTMWGSGEIKTTAYAGATVTLQCFTCHNPHGKANGGTATYRILEPLPDVTEVMGPATPVSDVSTKVYTISDTTGKYYGQKYPAASDTDTDNDKIATLSSWCARCHNRIHATNFNNSTDAIYKYRHRTDGSNVSNSSGSGAPACLTCHVAHGTIAAAANYAATVPKPGTAEGGGNYLVSSLLRIDNRGVCEACHNK